METATEERQETKPERKRGRKKRPEPEAAPESYDTATEETGKDEPGPGDQESEEPAAETGEPDEAEADQGPAGEATEDEEAADEPELEPEPEPEPPDLSRLKITLRRETACWILTVGAPGADPQIEYVELPELADALNYVPDAVNKARERWETTPRYPRQEKPEKGTEPRRRNNSQPPTPSRPKADAPGPRLF